MLPHLHGVHVGDRAFVIGNVSTLQVGDLDRLQREITFGANTVIEYFGDTSWRPTYWLCTDPVFAKQHRNRIFTLEQLKFGTCAIKSELGDCPDFTVIPGSDCCADERPKISDLDLEQGVYAGLRPEILMLKLAHWMGIRVVYLVGVDFGWTGPFSEIENESLQIEYRKFRQQSDYLLSHPDRDFMLARFQILEFLEMQWAFESVGCRVFDASEGASLNLFESIDLDSVL